MIEEMQFELFNNNILFSYIAGIIGIIVAIITIRNAFSVFTRRQELKIELEIFEILKRNPELDSSHLKDSIDVKLNTSFQSKEDDLMGLLLGFVLFTCFGYVTYNLFLNNYSIVLIALSMFASLTGLTMMFGKFGVKSGKQVFLKVAFYDRTNFRFRIIVLLLMGSLFLIFLFRSKPSYTGLFITGALFLISLVGLIKSIKEIK